MHKEPAGTTCNDDDKCTHEQQNMTNHLVQSYYNNNKAVLGSLHIYRSIFEDCKE